jgi:hypothetical protein
MNIQGPATIKVPRGLTMYWEGNNLIDGNKRIAAILWDTRKGDDQRGTVDVDIACDECGAHRHNLTYPVQTQDIIQRYNQED